MIVHESDVELRKEQLERHARHVSLRSFGAAGQQGLCKGSVLIVGAGGLGCPCAMYLAGAGVGRLGVVDDDTVATSNLHRQIAHSEAKVGTPKAASLQATCAALNSSVAVAAHTERLLPHNAAALCGAYDVVADCSDNPATRYLVNDACVATGTPLVSGAAVGTDGQLSVYGFQGGPCYRCVYPECPSAANCSSCEEAGVLGPVPGVIGTLQALECIKLLSGVGAPLSQSLLVYDALSARFNTFKLRGRRADCAACSPASPLQQPEGVAAYDYTTFTGGQSPVEAPETPPLPGSQAGPLRLAPAALQRMLADEEGEEHDAGARVSGCGGAAVQRAPPPAPVLVDVRPKELFSACRLPGSMHVPMREVEARAGDVRAEAARRGASAGAVVVVCRRGNDSQLAAARLRQCGLERVFDLVGGLHAWVDDVDPSMPKL